MNLKNKTDKELSEIIDDIEKMINEATKDKEEIHQEIIRREKERIVPYKDYVCDKLRRKKDDRDINCKTITSI